MLEPAFAAGSFDEDAAHGFRRGGEEMAAAVPVLGLFHVHQPQIGFMDQGRGLERLAGFFPGQFPRGQLAQLVVDQRQELLGGVRVALLDGGQDARDLGHAAQHTPAEGEPQASEQLLPLVYDELRKLAARRLSREKPGQTLQATALVHEAYLRLVGGGRGPHWDSRAHFFGAAAEAMRRLLIDRARRKRRPKHGGGRTRVSLDEVLCLRETPDDDVLALDEALQKLAGQEPAKAELVKLHYFAGLTLEEAGRALGISHRTAKRHWAYARAWLYAAISDAPPSPAD